MNQAILLISATPTQDTLFCGSVLQVFSQTGPPRRVDCLARREISVKCLSQGRNDEMPDSSIEAATFRLPAGALPTELRR